MLWVIWYEHRTVLRGLAVTFGALVAVLIATGLLAIVALLVDVAAL